jgi:hypothetical protein
MAGIIFILAQLREFLHVVTRSPSLQEVLFLSWYDR